MFNRNVRELDDSERSTLDAQLQRFRTEYAAWREMYPSDRELLDFVHYEGVAGNVIEELEPLIFGSKCVALYGCRWCMIQVGNQRHFGIDHDSLDEPVDLSAFNKKRLRQKLSRRWQQRLLHSPRRPN
jgi:hypothetical protein